MTSRLYVIRTISGHHWLVRGNSERTASARYQAEVDRGDAEEMVSVSRPDDRSHINYLRRIGQADANA